jgi:polyvinyl alcohol dehydrogenase (cytochrome)
MFFRVQLSLPVILICSSSPLAQTGVTARPNPSRTFDQTCTTCHGNPNAERAPDPATLRRMTPEKIYEALTTGSMRAIAMDLSDELKPGIAEYLSERKIGSGESADPKSMPNQCRGGSADINVSALIPAWNGRSPELLNTRFQSAEAAKLSIDQVKKLRFKWAFGLPGATVTYG